MGETNSEIINKQDMYSTFQNWALRNYGDTGKTKTVTAKKYERIINILTGEDRPTTENSKFRFWVKAKGFRLGCQHGHNDLTTASVLYVPAKNTDTPLSEEGRGFKRVAVVEDFFDIIYNVHVEMDGRGGRHAGQKRTYRAIAETYSFLPREAVTRFLMSCSDCQKRMHLSMNETMETNNNQPADDHMTKEPPITDFTLPITNTYLNRMKAKMTECFDEGSVFQTQDEDDSMSSVCSLASGDKTPFSTAEDRQTPHVLDLKKGDLSSKSNSRTTSPISLRVYPSNSIGAEPISMADRNGSILEADDRHVTMGTPLVRPEEKSHVDRKRRASSESLESSATKESAADDTKDDEDDNEDEDEDKLVAGHGVDPERLKAFNMFVRLFVDENLDRMVPISKQPKDKIQAILEACDRQFPEFHERSRKRVRTYLKSCRRMRRSKEGNGWDQVKQTLIQIRPTPPHLTSAAAEGILAHACENESSNAKRMRMGMDPLPAAEMTTSSMVSSRDASQPPASSTPSPAALPLTSTPTTPTPAHAHVSPPSSSSSVERQPTTNSDYLRHVSPTAPTAFRPPQEIVSPFLTNNNGIFRPGFPNRFEQHPAHHHTPVLQHSPVSNTIQNGPTDLSMKKSSSPSKNQLNPSEVATIKQLIAGYRESAAFLYRSADELEQLLLQQN